jgi:amidohydrolase
MNNQNFLQIKKISEEIFPYLVKLRRRLHQYPETSFEEFKTSQMIAKELRKIGLKVKTGIAKTGVVGVLESNKIGKTVALRADMDALPISELTNLPYASKNRGKMHACGHDAHITCLIGAAMILNKLKENFKGSVKFIFQPSEEAGPGGAIQMIREGVLSNPKVNSIFALHCDSNIPVGKVGVKNGIMMAYADDFDIIIRGKGGHGARPQDGVDAIVVASQIINSLQTIVSRRIDPLRSAVVSIGIVQGGSARNIICDKVILKGTIRSLEKKVAKNLPIYVKQIVSGITQSYGADFEFTYRKGYPVLINYPQATDIAREVIKSLYTKEAVYEIERPVMGGEDFARFLEKVGGTMMRLGIRNEKIGATYPWHHPRFKIDERALKFGSSILAGVVLKSLQIK